MRTSCLVVLLSLGALLAPRPCAAGEPAAALPLTRSMEAYFMGELEESWVFAGTGLATMGTGVWLLLRDEDAAQGAAWPMMGFGLIQAAAGVILGGRTGGQVQERREQIAADPDKLLDSELARMERVNLQFTVLQWLEMALIAGGVAMAIAGEAEDLDTLSGVGLGLTAQSLATLALDTVAAARARTYTDQLRALRAGAGGLLIGWRGGF